MRCPCSSQAKELTLTSSCHPPPSNGMVCCVTPKYRHVPKYTIYKFICLSATNLKYLLHSSCIGCVPIHYDIEQVHTFYKREVICFYHKVMHDCTRKPKMCIQISDVHTYFKVKMVLGARLSNTKVTRIPKWQTLSVCYCALMVNYCLLFFVLFASAEQW